jgi:hypothetical protein
MPAPATSHILRTTFPFLTLRKLNATVGTTSSLHLEKAKEVTGTILYSRSTEAYLPRPDNVHEGCLSGRLKAMVGGALSEGRVLTCKPTTAISASLVKNRLQWLRVRLRG